MQRYAFYIERGFSESDVEPISPQLIARLLAQQPMSVAMLDLDAPDGRHSELYELTQQLLDEVEKSYDTAMKTAICELIGVC